MLREIKMNEAQNIIETANYNLIQGAPNLVKAWTKGVTLEASAVEQIRNTASLPFIHKWVAIMPDAHWGMGATVGSVVATKKAIVPAAVGVDLGCGMIAARTSLRASDLPDSLKDLRLELERKIPHGGPGAVGSWAESGRYGPPNSVGSRWRDLEPQYKLIMGKYPQIREGLTVDQLGTLGTGNHFVEVCLEQVTDGSDPHVWIMLHSGSRGVGNRIASFFIEQAKKDMRRWHINLPDADLAYIPEGSEFFEDYWTGVSWAQNYASINRYLMMERAIQTLSNSMGGRPFTYSITANCHHNYVAIESHYGEDVYVTRKGAVRARVGDIGIIPGSMGARSYIVRGKGNPESFNSCSHGAGRLLSRGEAKRRISLEDHAKAVAGVECRLDEGVLDESPDAYKPIEAVMEAQKDLVEVMYTLKQIVCVKG